MRLVAVTGLAIALAITGCGSKVEKQASSKAGAKVSPREVKKLSFATFDAALLENPGLLAFTREVKERSGGRLVVEPRAVDFAKYQDKLPDLVASGRYDLGYSTMRRLATMDPAFLAPPMPLLIDSDELHQKAYETGLGDHLREQLDPKLEPLAILVGEIIRPWSKGKAATTPQDFASNPGLIRYGEQTEPYPSVLRAIGLKLHTVTESHAPLLNEGKAGMMIYGETGLLYNTISGWGMVGTLNISFGAEGYMMYANAERLERLTEQERNWLREAGRRAEKASRASIGDDLTNLAKYCRDTGLRATLADEEDVETLHAKAAAVYRDFDSESFRRAVQLIEDARDEVETEPPVVPAECRGPLPEAARPIERNADPTALNGTYRFTTTAKEYLDAGFPDPVVAKDAEGTITVRLRNGDSTLTRRKRNYSSGQKEPPLKETYKVDGDRVTFFTLFGPVTVRWEKLDDGSLRFKSGLKLTPALAVDFGKTWQRVR